MQPVIDLEEKIAEVNEDYFMSVLFDSDPIKAKMIELNTQKQLFDKGIDSKGNTLGDYSDFTIHEKLFNRNPTQPIDRVTLKDSGAFYKSFSVEMVTNEIIIDAVTQKADTNLADIYGIDILGLTDESLGVIRSMAKEVIINRLNELLR